MILPLRPELSGSPMLKKVALIVLALLAIVAGLTLHRRAALPQWSGERRAQAQRHCVEAHPGPVDRDKLLACLQRIPLDGDWFRYRQPDPLKGRRSDR